MFLNTTLSLSLNSAAADSSPGGKRSGLISQAPIGLASPGLLPDASHVQDASGHVRRGLPLDWNAMRSSRDQTEDPVVEADCSQLWLRQRPLRATAKPVEPDGSNCTCGERQTHPSVRSSIDSAELLAGRREIQIVHAGETYRLLVTRNNKLILQK